MLVHVHVHVHHTCTFGASLVAHAPSHLFDEKTHVAGNPASVHTTEGNPENCVKVTVNPEIGGLTHLASRVRKYPGKVGI